MNTFIKKLVIFLIIPIIFIGISDTYLRNKNSLYKEKFNGALEEADQIEILILGNSHANYGVDPTAFDNYAFNLANVNQSFYFDKRITLKLFDKLDNLKFVLISADYHSLYFSDQGLRNFWSYQGHGVKYKNEKFFFKRLSPTLFGYPPKVVLSYIRRDLRNIILYNGKGVDYPVQRGVSIIDTIEQGFIGYSGSMDFSNTKYQNRANIFNQQVKDKSEKGEIQKDLTEFIEFLKSQEVTPILFSTPTYKEYNEFLNKRVAENNKVIYNKISSYYNIPYWDFMDSKLFNRSDFYDEDHLNKVGAKKFGRFLNDSIKALRRN